MIHSVVSQLTFSFYRHRRVRVDFCGGQVTGDAGLLTLRAFDQRHKLTGSVADLLSDLRDRERVQHDWLSLLRHRLYGIVAGYEDANDAQRLRLDPIFQMLSDQPLGQPLGSQPTLSRWENAASAFDVVRGNRLLLDWFIRVCGEQVRQRGEILLDVDSTDDPTHGHQQLSMFNGHFGYSAYHPLLIFERHTGALLGARLRRGNCVSYNRVVPFLRPLLLRLRAAFPGVRILLRADAGFAIGELYDLLESQGVEYAIRFITHRFLRQRVAKVEERIRRRYQASGAEQRFFTSLYHDSRTWGCRRRLCVEIHCPDERLPVRFILTNMNQSARQVTEFYNQRGECENRIAEFKNGFHADRLSCHRFTANAFRLLLHSLAYNLVNLFRHSLPASLSSLQISTLRVRLFKVGARVSQSARRVWVHLATGWPHQRGFVEAALANSG